MCLGREQGIQPRPLGEQNSFKYQIFQFWQWSFYVVVEPSPVKSINHLNHHPRSWNGKCPSWTVWNRWIFADPFLTNPKWLKNANLILMVYLWYTYANIPFRVHRLVISWRYSPVSWVSIGCSSKPSWHPHSRAPHQAQATPAEHHLLLPSAAGLSRALWRPGSHRPAMRLVTSCQLSRWISVWWCLCCNRKDQYEPHHLKWYVVCIVILFLQGNQD